MLVDLLDAEFVLFLIPFLGFKPCASRTDIVGVTVAIRNPRNSSAFAVSTC